VGSRELLTPNSRPRFGTRYKLSPPEKRVSHRRLLPALMRLSTTIAVVSVFAMSLACLGKKKAVEGQAAGECSDDADNDGDGLFDCNDDDCAGASACLEESDTVSPDDDDDDDDDEPLAIASFESDCSNNRWNIAVTTTQPINEVDVEMLDNPDLCSEFGCWSDSHPLDGNKKKWDTSLDVVSSVMDVSDNATVFPCDYDPVLVATAYDDSELVCAVIGNASKVLQVQDEYVQGIPSDVLTCLEEQL
jgi:hypothetical protein